MTEADVLGILAANAKRAGMTPAEYARAYNALDEKVPVVIVTRPATHGAQKCICALSAFSASDEFDGADDGESITLTLGHMTKLELAKLPDFEGW